MPLVCVEQSRAPPLLRALSPTVVQRKARLAPWVDVSGTVAALVVYFDRCPAGARFEHRVDTICPRKGPPVKFFLDESGNGNTDQPLIVGAVEVGDDAAIIEERLRDLHARLSASHSLIGHPKFEDFRKHGFHSSSDPQDVSGPFMELVRTFFYRTYLLVTDRSGVPGRTEAERVEFMYVKMLSDLLIRFRGEATLECFVEQGTGMGPIVGRLPSAAADQASRTLGQRATMPQLVISQAAKGDHMSMAIVDYVMAATARWMRADFSTDPSQWSYRSFRDFEPSMSVLYSFERGRISSRKDPLH